MEAISNLLLNPENERLLRAHIHTLVLYAYEAPFVDIMEGARDILDRVSKVQNREEIYVKKWKKGKKRGRLT